MEVRLLALASRDASPRLRRAVAVLGGLGLTLAFPPLLSPGLQAWPAFFAWSGLLPLLWLGWDQDPAASFRSGFLYGFVFFAVSLFYLNHVRPMGPGALPAWLGLSAWCALFPALFALVLSEGSRRAWAAPLLWIPAAWTLSEHLREHLLTGYPWVSLGSSQWGNGALLPLAGVTGPAGLHFAVALGNAIAFAVLLRQELALGWARCSQALAAAGLLLGLLQAAKSAAPVPDLARPAVGVAVIQGNVDQDQAWTPEYRLGMMRTYLGLMEQARAQGATVFLWPESAFPAIFDLDPPEAAQLKAYAREHHVDILAGSPWYVKERDGYENAVVWVSAKGELGRYAKRHLVLFGEAVPFREQIPLLDLALTRLGLARFLAGSEARSFDVQGLRSSPLICFESIFSGLAREAPAADMLAVVTLDTWFGRSVAPYHHASQACLRAVENGAWVARAAATGVSCFVDPAGRMLAFLPLDSPGFLVQRIQPMRGETLFRRFGDWFQWLCLLLLVICARWPRKSQQ
jgi:apolipoprotein N-acyltransferase